MTQYNDVQIESMKPKDFPTIFLLFHGTSSLSSKGLEEKGMHTLKACVWNILEEK